MSRGGKCRPETAAAIVNLLNQGYSGGEYANQFAVTAKPTPDPPAAEISPKNGPETRRYRRHSKITPEIWEFIGQRDGIRPQVVVDEVEQRFGLKISIGAVYKCWNAYLAGVRYV